MKTFTFKNRITRATGPVGCAIALLVGLSGNGLAQQSKVFFYDDDNIVYRAGTKRVLKPMTKRGTVLTPSGWEATAGNKIALCSVSFSGTRNPRYQMWYQVDSTAQGFTGDDKRYDNVVAYAYSSNGTVWTKPNLVPDTTFHYPGAVDNNIVLRGIGSTTGNRFGCSVVYDETESNADRRYKMVYTDWKSVTDSINDGVGLQVAFSPDGVDWNKYNSQSAPTVLQKIGYNRAGYQPPKVGYTYYFTSPISWRIPMTMSTVMNLLIEPAIVQSGTTVKPKTYVIYGKMAYDGPDGAMDWKGGVGRITSTDFLTWTQPELIDTPDDGDGSAISFQDSPVLKYEHMYLCLNQLADTTAGTNDIELMTSRDGKRWDRFRKNEYANVSVLPRATGTTAFDSKAIYTNASINVGDALRFYYGGNSVSSPTVSAIGMADVKRDRLVGLESMWIWGLRNKTTTYKLDEDGDRVPARNANGEVILDGNGNPTWEMILEEDAGLVEGSITLKPMDVSSFTTMYINAKTTTVTGDNGPIPGHIEVEVLDHRGYIVDNFTRDLHDGFAGDAVNADMTWGSGARGIGSLSSVVGLDRTKVSFRIYLTNATIYSVWFE